MSAMTASWCQRGSATAMDRVALFRFWPATRRNPPADAREPVTGAPRLLSPVRKTLRPDVARSLPWGCAVRVARGWRPIPGRPRFQWRDDECPGPVLHPLDRISSRPAINNCPERTFFGSGTLRAIRLILVTPRGGNRLQQAFTPGLFQFSMDLKLDDSKDGFLTARALCRITSHSPDGAGYDKKVREKLVRFVSRQAGSRPQVHRRH